MIRTITKRSAIREARAEADAIIEQLERRAKGWDKGAYRDDDTERYATIAQRLATSSAWAFHLSRMYGQEVNA